MVFVPTGSPANASNFGNPIDRSLRFNDDDSAYLSRTPGSASNRKTWTWSGWVKRANLALANNASLFTAGSSGTEFAAISLFATSDELYVGQVSGGGDIWRIRTTAKFRDPSAWYHFVVALDTTQATSTDRVKIYVNGVQQTSLVETSYPTLNYDSHWNNNIAHNIGRTAGLNARYHDGYMAEIHFIDGTAYDADDFGEFNSTTGEWVPKEVTGLTYGTNGFYLPFSDNTNTTTLGEDSSGNSNDWTLNNLATSDSVTDTPTDNFATLSYIDRDGEVLSDGNLRIDGSSNLGRYGRGTHGVTSGQWYFEVVVTAIGGSGQAIGIATPSTRFSLGNISSGSGVLYYNTGSRLLDGEAWPGTAYGATFTTSDVLGVAIDLEADPVTATFYKNNSSQGSINMTAAADAGWMPIWISGGSGSAATFNFGQITTSGDNADENGHGSFEYAPPSGALALCAANLPEPTIVRPRNHFDVITYTGDGTAIGSGGQSVTGDESWTPGFVWIKNRDATDSHMLFDEVRGATKYLESDTTDDEATDAESLTSFDAGGFTVGSNVAVNTNTEDFVAWLWKSAGSASNNTTGDITSSVSVNTTAGISIGTYTGTGTSGHTIGHGLGDTPGLILVKARTTASTNTDWAVYHRENTSAPETDYLNLNDDGATADDAGFWNDTAPTSTVFSVGNNAAVNTASDTYGFLAFAEVPGFSKFGSYTGNLSTDGPFVWCGFKPRWVLIKALSTGVNWHIFDTERSTFNPVDDKLRPNRSAAEAVAEIIDITANGFKVRTNSAAINNTTTYVFAAFADIPFKYARAR